MPYIYLVIVQFSVNAIALQGYAIALYHTVKITGLLPDGMLQTVKCVAPLIIATISVSFDTFINVKIEISNCPETF